MFDNEYNPATEFDAPPPTEGTNVNFANQAPLPDAINFTPPLSNPYMPLAVSDNRAAKAHFALQDDSPGLDTLKAQFGAGGEDNVRQNMAAQAQIKNNTDALAMVQKVSQTEGPLTPEDTNFVMETMKTRTVDPSTVLEHKFAQSFTQFGTTIKPEVNQVFSHGWEYLPGETSFEQIKATDTITRSELANTILENVENRWQNTPWFSFKGSPAAKLDNSKSAADAYLTAFIPFMSWANQRQALKGIKTDSLMPGSNMADFVESLWLIPDKERFKSTLTAAVDQLWQTDPISARILAKAATTFSKSEVLMGNLFGWADIAAVVPVGALFKGGRWVGGLWKANRTSEAPSAIARVSDEGLSSSSKWLSPAQEAAAKEITGKEPVGPSQWGPASDLLPQDVRDASREIVGRSQKTNFLQKIPNADQYDIPTDTFRVRGGSGVNVEVVPQQETKNLRINWAGKADGSLAEDFNNPAKLGTARVRQIMYELKEQYPWAETITAKRITGARAGKEFEDAEIKVNLPTRPRIEKGPQMSAQRGWTMQTERGPSMQIEKGPSVELPSQEVSRAIAPARDLNLPLYGPTSASRLPHLEGEPSREQYMSAWHRYYQRNPWHAPSDVNPDGTFPAALIPKGAVIKPYEDRYETMMQGVRQAMGDIVKASGTEGKIDIEVTLAKLGDIEGAAKIGINRIAQTTSTAGLEQAAKEGPNLYEFSKDLPSSLNPSLGNLNPVGLSRARAQAILTKMQARGAAFIDKLGEMPSVERLPPEAVEQAYKEAATDLRYQYHSFPDHILDIVNNDRDPYTNTRTVTMQLGNRGKLPFETEDQAALFARDIFKISENGYTVSAAQQGIGYILNVTKPITETEKSVQALIAGTKYSQTPISGIAGMLFGKLRSAEDLLSEFNRANRHTATHPVQGLRDMFLQTAGDIRSLGKTERQEVQDILRANRDFENAAGERGKFYQTIGDFEIAFQGKFNKLPSEKQVNAYFSYIQLSDMDWTLRNLGALRDKQRLGTEIHQFPLAGGQSPKIEGKILREFPTAITQDSGILILKDSKTTGEYLRRHDPEFDSKAISKMLNDEGFQLIQVAEPNVRPLLAATGEKDIINFVITQGNKTEPLPWKQVQYKPGGHVIYPYEWWVKQPQIATGRGGQQFYYGDKNLFNFSSQAEAKGWAERMEAGRKLLDNEAALNAYVPSNTPYSVKEFKELFQQHLSPDLPISHSESGRSTLQTDPVLRSMFTGQTLRNDADSVHNLYQGMDKTFLADRDLALGTISGEGTPLKPWKMDNAPLIDPYPALNQALGQAMRARWMNDYKIAAATEWVQQFKGIIKNEGNIDFLTKNPLATLYNAEFARVSDGGMTRNMAVSAENARQRIIDFIGSKTEFESNITRIQSVLADEIFNRFGKGAADTAVTHVLPWIKDPTEWTRAVAFHSHLGLFNPVQLLVQSQTMFNAIAIAGASNGGKGAVMGTLQHFLYNTENPAMIERMAKINEAVTGVKAEWFKEGLDFIKNSGIWHVGGETAWKNNVFEQNLFSKAGTYLDKSSIFFNTGERQTRLTGANMAYLEWRVANPTAELTNKVFTDILNRTDTLTGNMTRASSAAWQKGFMSVPTQFLAYNARTTELMLGKRLTEAEKHRLFGMWAVMYGVPTALGGTVGAIDTYTDIKEQALKEGIPMSDNYIKAVSEGLPSLLTSLATGKSYDMAKRFGPGGNSLFEDAWSGKKTIDEVIGGPSWQTTKQIAQTMRPFYWWAYGHVTGKPDEYPIQIEDFAAAAQETGTGSAIIKAIYGLQTGMYATKNDVKVGPITNVDSILRGTLGITPMDIQETLMQKDVLKHTKDAQEKEIQKMLTEYRRGMDNASAVDDYKSMQTHFNKAMVIGQAAGLNPQQISDVWRRFTTGETKTMQQKVNEDWYKNSPSWYQKERYEQLKTKQDKQ